MKPSKCALFQKRVSFLGHVISEEGVTTDPAKTEKVKSWPTPTTQSQLRHYLGLASYYRRFVHDLATICRPLHRLIEKGSSFNWTEECQEAFDTLRLKLTTLSFQILSSRSSWTQMQVILGLQLCCRKCVMVENESLHMRVGHCLKQKKTIVLLDENSLQ